MVCIHKLGVDGAQSLPRSDMRYDGIQIQVQIEELSSSMKFCESERLRN